jgi:hypothetical protein
VKFDRTLVVVSEHDREKEQEPICGISPREGKTLLAR